MCKLEARALLIRWRAPAPGPSTTTIPWSLRRTRFERTWPEGDFRPSHADRASRPNAGFHQLKKGMPANVYRLR
jgi:hypothetical protein